MPYAPQPPRRDLNTQESVVVRFQRRDGQAEIHVSVQKTSRSSPQVDLDTQTLHQKVELGCGCYWPEVEVAGVCADCDEAGEPPNICQAHFVICRCGVSCCWKHSHPLDTGQGRLCRRCHRREQNQAFVAAVTAKAKGIARWIFFSP